MFKRNKTSTVQYVEGDPSGVHTCGCGKDHRERVELPPIEVLAEQVRELTKAIDSCLPGQVAIVGVPAPYLLALQEDVLAHRSTNGVPFDQDADVLQGNFGYL